MPSRSGPSRRGLAWAIAGGAVLLVGVAAILIASLTPRSGTRIPSPTVAATETAPSASESPEPEFVDATAAERGWVPEPITTDVDVYIRAALAAASTFDTRLSSRSEWLSHLDSWFTPDPRYTSDADRHEDMEASQLELRQGVVLPEAEWSSLANEDGRVVAATSGDITYAAVPDDAAGDMTIGTADVSLVYTRSDGQSGETSYEEKVRVSVQVLCGPESEPTPDTQQRAGDCKVVRFFSGSLEP